MSSTLIGALITAAVSIFGFWLKWRLGKAKEDQIRRMAAEQETKEIKEGISRQQKLKEAHENSIIEIADGVSDDRASELFSSSPKDPKIPSPSDS